MTLPYPDKPAITDTFATIISNILDNSTDLDSGGLLKVVSWDYNVSVAGANPVTGVGFTPTTVIIFACETVSDAASWGFQYGTTAYESDVGYDGDTDASSSGITFLSIAADKYTYATISSYDADGFTLTWTKTGLPTGTANCIALCIG